MRTTAAGFASGVRSGVMKQDCNMGLIQLFVVFFLIGCGAENNAPPPFTPQHRETIRQNLAKLGAKVTAETPEELYLSLRKTHVELRDLGGTIEGTFQTRRDIQDFGTVNEAVAKAFLENGEFQDFKKWLRKAMNPSAPSVLRSEYDQFKVTLSRKPLLAVFTRKQSKVE
jgi:hypothetical protein